VFSDIYSKNTIMARPKKKKVELSTDSFLSMAQEAYNELVEQRSTAIRQINENKKKVEVEDVHDLTNMSKANTDLLKLVDNTIDKKLSLIKLMSTLIFKGDKVESSDSGSITPEDLQMIQELMGNNKDDNDDEYKIKD
jgi:nicotinate-nucleotide pyrophosphorylase